MGKKSRRRPNKQQQQKKKKGSTGSNNDSDVSVTSMSAASTYVSLDRPNPSHPVTNDNSNSNSNAIHVTSSNEVATKDHDNEVNATVSAVAAAGTVVADIDDSEDVPFGLRCAFPFLTPYQRQLATLLCSKECQQAHLFQHWKSSDAQKDHTKAFMDQLERMNKAYRGGLVQYIRNARELLQKAKIGANPLSGFEPHVPSFGESLSLGSEEYKAMELSGLKSVGKCGFVLVAGGLGERLGYSGIKLGLPTETSTMTCYLQFYIEMILAIQARYAESCVKLPLCIMVSKDTNAGTLKLLNENSYFGMSPEQVTIVQQGDGVPALLDNDARLALDPKDKFNLLAKPHGHGDIHTLLYDAKVTQKWLDGGIRWAVFCQDTNALGFHTLPVALGVSRKHNLIMNSITVPRKAKQAIGAIATLVHSKTKEERTINVEYNQLDPLLRSTSQFPEGDVNDPQTGYSPFPGNINQLVFDLDHYNNVLQRTQGAMPEFVNPKYKDESKTTFKKPTRLECMMQDFPTVLQGDDAKFVGFTSISADFCFSPVKNATEDGVKLQQSGTHPGVAATGEADQYGAIAQILRTVGCSVGKPNPMVFNGISITPGPDLVLKPSFVTFPSEYTRRFPNPKQIKISDRSSLVITGEGDFVSIESLNLDGALEIHCEPGASAILKGLNVQNEGWVKDIVPNDNSVTEVIRMRGFRIRKIGTRVITIKKDGTILDSDDANILITDKVPSLTQPANNDDTDGNNDCHCLIQ